MPPRRKDETELRDQPRAGRVCCWSSRWAGARWGSRRPAARARVRLGRRVAVLPTMAAATAMLYLAPHLVPAAAIRPAVAFAAGGGHPGGGLVLRGWSIMTLGEYFTGRVMVSADQPVITAGPYRVLRHLSYFGFLLCCAGAGLASAN